MGYARISTSDQELRLQLDALAQHGCQLEHIFVDTASGVTVRRQGLEACLAMIQLGDVLSAAARLVPHSAWRDPLH
jgi:DNA invertase Pin-like site-specific DNA recombinase